MLSFHVSQFSMLGSHLVPPFTLTLLGSKGTVGSFCVLNKQISNCYEV